MSGRVAGVVLLLCVVVAIRTTVAQEATLGPLPPHPLGPIVVLADGGMLAARLESIDETGVTVRSSVLGKVVLPRAAVRGYRVSAAIGLRASPILDERAGGRAVVRLANGDEVEATRVATAGDDLRVHAELPVHREILIPIARVRAIDFSVGPAPGGAPRRLVAVVDGSRFTAQIVPGACDPADVVAEVDDGGAVQLLAGLDHEDLQRSAAGQSSGEVVRGATCGGDWPAARGTTAFTGLGIHSPARIGYRFEKPAARFRAQVAIDDSAGQGGSVIVRVVATEAMGRSREVHASPILRGGDALHAIDVGLDGATGIELIVDPADVGSVLDRTIWLDPRVER